MRTFLVAALLLTAALSLAPAEARPYPVECHAGLSASTCTADAVACDASAVTAYDGSFQSVGVACVGGVSCGAGLSGAGPTGPACSVPASASVSAAGPGYGCEPTPHGTRCAGDLVLCTVYSGAESSGIGYQGFDCGVVSCDFMTYQGRIKDRDCSVGAAATASSGDPRDLVPEARPLPVDCVFTGFTTWCSVDAVVCQYRQTQYHVEERQETELRCLGIVECTWGSGGASASRAEAEPFCPVSP